MKNRNPGASFQDRVLVLCQQLWPTSTIRKNSLLSGKAARFLRANRFLHSLVPAPDVPVINRVKGGDYNRITPLTAPVSSGLGNRELMLRTPRPHDDTRQDRSIAILDYVRQHTLLLVPPIFAKDFTTQNPLEQPYVIQHHIPGFNLKVI